MEGNLVPNFNKKSLTLVYLDKVKIEVVVTDTGAKLTFPFPNTLVLDCEVLNRDTLVQQVSAFIQAQKLTPSIFIIVLSPHVIFTKNFPLAAAPQSGDDMQTFLNNVPFEYVLTNLYKSDKEQTLIVANKELVESVQESFELNGFVMESVTPSFIFGPTTGLETGITDVNSKIILSKRDAARQHSLAPSPVITASAQSATGITANTGQKQQDKKRLFLLVGVFGVLIVVLIGVIIWSGQSSTPPPTPKRTQRTAAATPTPATPTEPVVAIQNDASPSAITQDSPTIQILSAGNTSDTTLTQSLLTRNGFTVTSVVPNTQPGTQTVISFAPTVPANTRSQIQTIVQGVFPQAVARQQATQAFDVMIIVGQN